MNALDFKTIIVTTDLSEESCKAYPFARSLAERYGASLILLTCVDSSMQYSQAGLGALDSPVLYSAGDDTKALESLAHYLLEHQERHFPGLRVKTEVLNKSLAVEQIIISYAREQSASLLVMASHGRSGIRRALLGSVAEYVLRHSECPVLIVPTRSLTT